MTICIFSSVTICGFFLRWRIEFLLWSLLSVGGPVLASATARWLPVYEGRLTGTFLGWRLMFFLGWRFWRKQELSDFDTASPEARQPHQVTFRSDLASVHHHQPTGLREVVAELENEQISIFPDRQVFVDKGCARRSILFANFQQI